MSSEPGWAIGAREVSVESVAGEGGQAEKDLKRASSYCLSGNEGHAFLRHPRHLSSSGPPPPSGEAGGWGQAHSEDQLHPGTALCFQTGRGLGRISACCTFPWMHGREGGTPT